jgi:hypothetical protein
MMRDASDESIVDPSNSPVTSRTQRRQLTTRYWLPRWVLDRTWSLLRQDGLKGVESTVLWGGRRVGAEATVLSVLYPCGADVLRHHRFLRVGADTTAEMGRWLREQGQAALIQVHTHPGSWTGHSDTDND